MIPPDADGCKRLLRARVSASRSRVVAWWRPMKASIVDRPMGVFEGPDVVKCYVDAGQPYVINLNACCP